MWYAGPIDILSYSYILLQYWKVLHDVIIDSMKYFIYWMTSDVMELPCTISPFNITGDVSFLLVLHLWYWGMRVVQHDMRVLVL